MLRVLCVCSGNTCRSPMAQSILQLLADRQNLPLMVRSAGLAAFAGDPAAENAVLAMQEIGGDLSAHRARPVSAYMLDESDYVICMSSSHAAALRPYVPAEKIVVPPGGVPDPFGGDLNLYRQTRERLFAFLDPWLKTVSAPVISPLTADTVPAVAAIEQACFSTPWSEESIRQELENEQALVLTLSVCKETVGYIGMHIVLDEAYMTNLAVLPAFRRKGCGRRLLEEAVCACKKRQCAFLTLEVRESNEAAQSLYRACGFVLCGRRKRFYEKPTEDALIYTRDFSREG